MLKFYYAQRVFWQILINIVYFVQIALFLLIFLLTLHWLLELVNMQFLNFMTPVSGFISGVVKLFYKRMIEVGGVKIDGTILLFDIIALLCIFAGAHLRGFFHKQITAIDIIIDQVAREEEARFNQQLQDDYEKEQLSKSCIGILLTYTLKNVMGNAFWTEQSEDLLVQKSKEVDKQIYYALSQLPQCEVAKTGNQFLILCNKFDKIDMLLDYVNALLAQVDAHVLQSQLTLTTYVAVEPYTKKTNTKDVFATLNKLLSLKMPGEIVCLGSLQLRYEFVQDKKYTPVLKGTYSIDESDKVWALVKKN